MISSRMKYENLSCFFCLSSAFIQISFYFFFSKVYNFQRSHHIRRLYPFSKLYFTFFHVAIRSFKFLEITGINCILKAVMCETIAQILQWVFKHAWQEFYSLFQAIIIFCKEFKGIKLRICQYNCWFINYLLHTKHQRGTTSSCGKVYRCRFVCYIYICPCFRYPYMYFRYPYM